jgi:hypothetical protein
MQLIDKKDKQSIDNKTSKTPIVIKKRLMTERNRKQELGMTGKMNMKKELVIKTDVDCLYLK